MTTDPSQLSDPKPADLDLDYDRMLAAFQAAAQAVGGLLGEERTRVLAMLLSMYDLDREAMRRLEAYQ